LQAAGIGEGDRVLDVGCATGYSSAVLAKLAGEVVALEEDVALARIAGETLAASGVSNVSVVSGPLPAGWQRGAPYDVIVVEGASEIVPAALLSQLKDGGRLVAVIGSGPMGKATIYRAAGGRATDRLCSTPPRRCCPALRGRRRSFFSRRVSRVQAFQCRVCA